MDVYNIRNQPVAIDAADLGDLDAIFVSDPSGTEALTRLGAYSRKFERQRVDYPVAIRVLRPDGVELDRGHAVIRNMTPEGAFLGDLALETGLVPVGPFSLHFQVVEGDLEGVEGSCRPVRIAAGNQGGIGVTFKKVYVRILGHELDEEDHN